MLPLRARPALLFLLLSLPAYAATAGTLMVASTTPGLNASNVARATSITIDFDRPVQTATVTESTLRVWGWSGGRTPTTRTWSNGNQTLTLTPGRAFFPGERVTVNL
ncbi:MAG: Ig-like domain-containing protein, partial [Xanthomonadales bacterium]|nr:Ig-like domain-containing protein [Xanthomonadales bacterium]